VSAVVLCKNKKAFNGVFSEINAKTSVEIQYYLEDDEPTAC
jgi:hypothetical protein